jgi:hypothetical protein
VGAAGNARLLNADAFDSEDVINLPAGQTAWRASDPNALPDLFREHLRMAKCMGPRLYRRSAGQRHVVFRSLRDAGITWSIVRGDDVVRVQRRAGHKLIGTTQRYIVEAENRGATFGTPFAPLPAALVGSAQRFGETAEKEASL